MKNKFFSKFDLFYVLFLGVLTVLTRLPYRTKFLFAWDSGTVALGTRHFDLLAHEPHPPGYIFYVFLAKILDFAFHDINAVLVWISIIAAALAGIFLYLLGKEMYGRAVGVMASLLLIFGKVFWAYSEVAFSYTLQCFLAILIVYLGYLALKYKDDKSGIKFLYIGSVVLAIAGGFRQDLIFFMIPVWLLVTLKYKKLFWKNWLIIILICSGWMMAMILWTGGFNNYFKALFDQFGYVSGFSVEKRGILGLIDNYRLMLLFLNDAIQGFPLIIFFAGYMFAPKKIIADLRLKILVLWILPAMIFYVLVHMGERGYLLTFIGGLLIIFAQGLCWFIGELVEVFKFKRYAYYIILAITAIILIIYNGYYFVKTEDFLSAYHLRNNDKLMKEKIEIIKKTKIGEVNFVDRENYKQLHYYLPEYNIYPTVEEAKNNINDLSKLK